MATPTARALVNRATVCLGLAASVAIAGCKQVPEKIDFWTAPNDPQVYAYVFNKCLQSTRGPNSTHYNDWDEAIDACSRAANSASDYCPSGARCAPSLVSRADVRAILPKSEAAQ